MFATLWKIVTLERSPALGNHNDVILAAHWRCLAIDEATGTSAEIYGATGFPLPAEDAADFVPYHELTQAQVLAWVHATLGAEQVAGFEAAVCAGLSAKLNPPVLHGLPWGAA